jgi:hypothetical protein
MADDLPLVQDIDVVVCDLQEHQKRMFQAMSRATGVAKQHQKGYYNLKVKGPEIQVGDRVVYEDKTNLRAFLPFCTILALFGPFWFFRGYFRLFWTIMVYFGPFEQF